MKYTTFFMILAAVLFAAILPNDTEAGRGKGNRGGQSGSSLSTQAQSMERNRVREGLHNRAGAGNPQPGTAQKRGNTYGPGDGTGNQGIGPQDGMGYGAPANR